MERVVNEDTILQKDTGQVAEFMGHFFRIANMPETISSADLFRQLCKHPYVVARDNCGQIIACKTPDELLVVPQPEMIEALGKATDERLAQVMRSYVLMKRSLKSLR
jgi:hypothetical protein